MAIGDVDYIPDTVHPDLMQTDAYRTGDIFASQMKAAAALFRHTRRAIGSLVGLILEWGDGGRRRSLTPEGIA